jgi:hypothetical protein
MITPRFALRVVPGALALVEVALLVAALHVPLARAMRERGLPRWRLRDTALVSPLTLLGALLALGSANHGMARLAFDVAEGHAHLGHAWLTLGVAAAGGVIAWFGLRAVAKLF